MKAAYILLAFCCLAALAEDEHDLDKPMKMRLVGWNKRVQEEFSHKTVDFQLARTPNINWGPYSGDLFPAESHDFCNVSQKYLSRTKIVSSIILAAEANCSIGAKVQNAVSVGAQMLIIYDSEDKIDQQKIKLHDKHGAMNQNAIPVLFISHEDGLKLKKLLSEFKHNGDDAIKAGISPISIIVKLEKPKTKYIDVHYWLTPSCRECEWFIRRFHEYAVNFEDRMIFHPHYVVYDGKGIAAMGYNKKTNCFFEGKYCFPDPDGSNGLDGQTMLTQSLRGHCLIEKKNDGEKYKPIPDAWWNYTIQYSEKCFKDYESANAIKKHDTCSEDLLGDYVSSSLFEDIKTCVKKHTRDEEHFFENEFNQWTKSGFTSWPKLTVNNWPLWNNPDMMEDVVLDICGFLTHSDKLKACQMAEKNLYSPPPPPSDGPSFTWTLIFVILLVFVLVVVFIYKHMRHIRLTVGTDLRDQVKESVSYYISMRETSRLKSGSD